MTAQPLRAGDPDHLGRYELTGRLGEGGMGTVYLGRTPDGQVVAVKMIRHDLAEEQEFRSRFREEVQRARQVPPFCTAEVLDADPDHEWPYLVVEYVDGPSLASVISERGPLSTSNLHALAIGVATALTAIHGAGVIHRDLKPNNVLLAPGSPKVIDFGIARAVHAARGHTRTDQQVGTVAYMAPERFDADARATPAADIFAWGAVVAYAGTGRKPFTGDQPAIVIARIMTQPPDLTGLAEPLRSLVAQALAKDPADRPSARDLLDRLLNLGPAGSPAMVAALASQPELRVAAEEAQAATDVGMVAQPTVAVGSEAATTRFVALPGAGAPRSVRSWRWLVAAIVAVVVLAGGTAVAASNGLLTFGGGTPRAGASPQASASPSPPVVSPSPAGLLVLRDPLSVERGWKARDDPDNGASCSFAGALVVRRDSRGPYRCPGPVDALTDISLMVEVRLLTAGSCASVWFRFAQNGGYALRVCASGYELLTHGNGGPSVVRTLRTMPFAKPIPLDTLARIEVVAIGTQFDFRLDGEPVGTWRDTTFQQGRVVLGIFTEEAGPAPPFRVSFANIEVRALN